MKHRLLSRHKLTAQGLLFGFAFLLCASAGAQNLLQNGDFEQPLGPTNWTVMYILGGPDDFEIKDRTIAADRHPADKLNTRGAHLRPSTDREVHAYFSQTVSNLVADHSYTIEGDVRWWGASANTCYFGNAPDRYRVYIDAIGGQAPARSPDVPNDGTDGWHHYSVTQTADANGNIEVRLHLDKFAFATYDKNVCINAYFDNFSVTY